MDELRGHGWVRETQSADDINEEEIQKVRASSSRAQVVMVMVMVSGVLHRGQRQQRLPVTEGSAESLQTHRGEVRHN